MSGSVKILSIILVLQIALSIWIYTGQRELDTFEAKQKLITLNKDDLQGLELVELSKNEETLKKETKSLVLNREGSAWNVKISDGFTFKALDSKVNELISNFIRIKRPLPVATSKISHTQLELTKDSFNKKIAFKTSDKEEVLMLGKSAGFKEVFARKSNEDNSYSIAFDVYSLEFDPMKWIDTDILVIDSSKIKNVKLPKVELKRKDNSFVLSDNDKVSLDTDKVNSIFKAIANLKIQSVLANKNKGLKELVKKVTFTYGENKKTYSFFVNSDNEYNLTVNGMPYIFTVAKAPVDKILGFKKDELIKVESKTEPKA